MNLNRSTDDKLSSSTLEDGESPRKKMKTEKSARKGWSLTDRKSDQDVLIEMGVGLLEQDEFEHRSETIVMASPRKTNLKRKRDIENVNPNTLGSPSKFSPKTMPSPGPSRLRSPKSSEKLKPLQPTDQQSLETSVIEAYQIDEETPMGQCITGEVFEHRACSTGGRTSRDSYASPSKPECPAVAKCDGSDSFLALSDEMMLSVFRWLPKRTLAHCMLVCKRWQRVSCDETLWQRLDLGNKTLAKGALGRILSRKPIIVRLASSEIGEWRPKTLIPSRIQYLDLSMSNIDQITLDALMLRCPGLKKLSLENVQVYETTFSLIGKCSNIETLNVTMSRGVTADGLKLLLEGCSSLQSLNISWCGLTEEALDVLVCLLPQRLQRLNLGGAKVMNDDMVSRLVLRCPRLLELDLSDCSSLNEPAITSILCLSRLEHLALSRCYYLPPHAFTRLSSMPALQFLEVWGMLQTASLTLLKSALPAIQVNQFMFSAIARPTVGNRRTSVWGLRTRD